MSSDEFDPALVEQAARAAYESSDFYAEEGVEWADNYAMHDRYRRGVRAVLTAVAPTLSAEGEANLRRLASEKADAYDEGYQRGKVDGAREVLTDAKAELAAMRPATDVNRLQLSRKHREDELERLVRRRTLNDVLELLAAREAVARIEKGGA